MSKRFSLFLSFLLVFLTFTGIFSYIYITRYHGPSEQAVLILMYHDIRENPVEEDNPWAISQDVFRRQMQTLRDEGYTVVTFDDLIAFVDGGRRLPERPVVITFDDGYGSNLELAAPILAEFGMSATISVIGEARGQSTYRDTDHPRIPHFYLEEARPWVERGVIQIQHHSYDMHMWEPFETPETYRSGALQRPDETEEEYRAAFRQDFETLRIKIEDILGTAVTVYTYPGGLYNEITEEMLRDLGVRVTLTTYWGINVIERRNPESLFLLKRINITEDLTGDRFIEYLDQFWETAH